ncbi:phosphatase PAP2 family protein [Persicitalea jodogahamensis]|uniref:Phosphatase PAP2 family protein n=1 Tax=Persicitalea jodogahamensis TaxID=402147 RepID=A0A8J3GCC2_9BACT|nr:phosphatase PAP2 family protein [Persicitalea jodogahamensis]GHB87766.1 phosphatase PAP2 family protein [Persicitalea jodogahamensis]
MKVLRLYCLLTLTIFSTASAQNADIRLLREINLNRNTQFDGFFKGVTDTTVPGAFSVPVIIMGVGLIKKDAPTQRKAVVIGAGLVASSGITYVMKRAINRPRPFVTYPDIQKLTDGSSPSFPSGHTSLAFATATSLSLEYPKWYVIVPSYAWAGTVGYSRMHLGVHYPSDVLAGAVIGAGSSFMTYRLNRWLQGQKK